jgi:hypothetical protein
MEVAGCKAQVVHPTSMLTDDHSDHMDHADHHQPNQQYWVTTAGKFTLIHSLWKNYPITSNLFTDF